jgi:kinesin family protein 11
LALWWQVEVAKYAAYVQRKVYLFHRVFSESTQQRQLYRQAVRPLILKALEGYNFTCFAYGQTGTGKTFTLTGDLSSSTGSADMGSAPIHELVSVQQQSESSHANVYVRGCFVETEDSVEACALTMCHTHAAVRLHDD